MNRRKVLKSLLALPLLALPITPTTNSKKKALKEVEFKLVRKDKWEVNYYPIDGAPDRTLMVAHVYSEKTHDSITVSVAYVTASEYKRAEACIISLIDSYDLEGIDNAMIRVRSGDLKDTENTWLNTFKEGVI